MMSDVTISALAIIYSVKISPKYHDIKKWIFLFLPSFEVMVLIKVETIITPKWDVIATLWFHYEYLIEYEYNVGMST